MAHNAMTCILCPAVLTASTRREHLIPAALGGRLNRRDLVCNDCNHRLGREADGPLAVSFEIVRYMLRVRDGNGGPPPTLRGIEVDDQTVNLAPDGNSFPTRPTYSVEWNGTTTEIHISARNLEESARFLAHAFRQRHATREDVVREVRNLRATETVAPFTEPTTLAVTFGESSHFRSIAKAAFEFLAHVRRHACTNPELAAVRALVRDGGRSEDFVRWSGDPVLELPFDADALGSAAHSIAIWADQGGPLAAQVTLFGNLRFIVKLADSWPFESFGAAHAVDPIAGRSLGEATLVPPKLSAAPGFFEWTADAATTYQRELTYLLRLAHAEHWRKGTPPIARNEAIDPDRLAELTLAAFDRKRCIDPTLKGSGRVGII